MQIVRIIQREESIRFDVELAMDDGTRVVAEVWAPDKSTAAKILFRVKETMAELVERGKKGSKECAGSFVVHFNPRGKKIKIDTYVVVS